ncbi:Taurine catabolism dioxygenase TauD, TfdA family [Geosmithia morbida]|uniref:Taurine catabolism dioxygenase TauD, TfdA family n=1 Tax=Geosmithia morbida TaxID=1094350 RepID=A0A9P4YW59_9HYPO|nr:Taurine catabolism dioxygenase TauD, TfdA family [Geosmithia morbida]KAF4123960.1 Taurine catabolism dioxygenase TauD, TfdA family [Geosmithia morbida]
MASCQARQPVSVPAIPAGDRMATLPVAEPLSASPLPTGFPEYVDSLMAWDGNRLADDQDEYILHLTQEDVREAESCLEKFKALGLDGDCINRENFPLPTLGPKLRQVRHQVYDGRGFGLIRGLDPERYSVEDLTMLYLGIQSFVANRHGRQDTKGNMMVHIVADDSSALTAEHHRHSTSPIAGDIVGWLTRSTAASGGRCIIASCYTIYNVLATDRPDLIRSLAGSDWPFALPEFHCRPILFHHQGRLITNFGRAALIGNAAHPRSSQLPSISPRQLEALEAVEAIARATELSITTEPGDVHFVNNLAILHRRDGFVDGPPGSTPRHLVRMRLRDDELGWAIPADLEPEWARAFGTGGAKVWHLEPMPSGYFPLRKQPN